jgi:hypothetical protein
MNSSPEIVVAFYPLIFQKDIKILLKNGRNRKDLEADLVDALTDFKSYPDENPPGTVIYQQSDQGKQKDAYQNLIHSNSIFIYKIRLGDCSKKKGKRYGLRLLIAYHKDYGLLFPLRIYSKEDKKDIEVGDLLPPLSEVVKWFALHFAPPPAASNETEP